MKKLFAVMILAINFLLPVCVITTQGFAERAAITEVKGELGKSAEFKGIAETSNWFMSNAPIVVAVCLIVGAAVMLFRGQFVIALLSLLAGLLAAGALQIVGSLQG